VAEQFAKAEQLYLDGNYENAIAAFKEFLLVQPEHAGAHWYLGTCYLYSQNQRWLGIAQGELETALALFERQGKVNPIPRFDATYFEMMCHINQAKIYLLLIDALTNDPRSMPGMNPQIVVPRLVAKCLEHSELADKVAPGHPDVIALRQLLAPILSPADTQRPQIDTLSI